MFTTPHDGASDTTWFVTQYDREAYFIEFVRMTPGENVVRINIELKVINENQTHAHIEYQHTGLNTRQNSFIENELEAAFISNMRAWEKSINHYLATGEMLV